METNELDYKRWEIEETLRCVGVVILMGVVIFLVFLFTLWFGATFLFYEDGEDISRTVAAVSNMIILLPILKWIFIVAAGSGGLSCFILLLSILKKKFIRDKSIQRKIYLLVGVIIPCFLLAWVIWLTPVSQMMLLISSHQTIATALFRWFGMAIGILILIIIFIFIFIKP